MGKTYLETTKYMIVANFEIHGLIEKPDVIGAIFGQSEGLLGSNLDIKELQQNGKIGRIEASINHIKNKTFGQVKLPCSLSMVETTIIAAAIETIEKVGPCDSKFTIEQIEDTRDQKRKHIKERAIDLLGKLMREQIPDSRELMEEIMDTFKTKKIITYGPDKLAAGPSIEVSKDIIVVEGRADIINLLKYGFTNTISTGGARVPKSLESICRNKTVTLFLDGDHGGDIGQTQLINSIKVDYVARAPDGKEVEELTQKEINQALRKRVKVENLNKRYDKHIVNKTKFSITHENKIIKKNLENTKNYIKKDYNSKRHNDNSHINKDSDLEHMLSGISNVERIDVKRSSNDYKNRRTNFNSSKYLNIHHNENNTNKELSIKKEDHQNQQKIVTKQNTKIESKAKEDKIKIDKKIQKEALPKFTGELKKSFLDIVNNIKDKKESRILNSKLRRIGDYSSSSFLDKLSGFKPNKIYAIITDLDVDDKLLKIAKEKNVKFIVAPSSKIKEDKEINIITYKMLK